MAAPAVGPAAPLPSPSPASSGGAAHGSVPVQLTTIVPVRVCDARGEYFDTEISLDAPMRVLQLAVEDFFKVKPEVQLLHHNRQQINPELTLRDNGCLLLKGEPYVKLLFLTKRGPLLNLVCHTAGRGGHTYPIAVDEKCTVWEAKRVLCEEMAAAARRRQQQQQQQQQQHQQPPSPHQLRLVWRYMELNDRAELHYYRIPTNAVLTVRVRPRARSPPSAARAFSAAAAPSTSAYVDGPNAAWARLRGDAAGPAPLPPLACDPRAFNAAATAAPSQRPQQAPPVAFFPPPPPSPQPVAANKISSSSASATARETEAAEGAFHREMAERNIVHYGAATAAAAVALPTAPAASPPPQPPQPLGVSNSVGGSDEVRAIQATMWALQSEITSLRQEVAAQQLYRGTAAAAAPSAGDFGYAAACRIEELEGSIARFHAYLQRAIALLP